MVLLLLSAHLWEIWSSPVCGNFFSILSLKKKFSTIKEWTISITCLVSKAMQEHHNLFVPNFITWLSADVFRIYVFVTWPTLSPLLLPGSVRVGWGRPYISVHLTVNTVQFSLYIVYCIVYHVYCKLYNVHWTKYTVHSTLYTINCTLWNTHCILFPISTVHSKLFAVHYTW